MDKKVKFFIPGIGDSRLLALNSSFIDKLEKYPEKFRPIEIGAVYGAPPRSTWAGGRFTYGYSDAATVRNEIAFYNSHKIPIRYTFTSTLIKDTMLYDQFCNLLMIMGNNGMNEVLVNNDILEKYIRETYPDYKVCLSTTKRISEKEQYDQYKGKYDYIVLDYSFNKKPEIFELEDKEHIEILIMTFCRDDCPNRMHHQYVANISDLELYSPKQHYGLYTCPYFQSEERHGWTFYDHMREHKHIIDVDDVYGKFTDAGFCNFKLEGRGNRAFEVMESYIYYLVLPEYRNEIRLAIAKDITGLNVTSTAKTAYKKEDSEDAESESA
jgi:collagenase-like PrtC family protease